MRLARTAAPLPRKSGWLESNQRFPVPETGGMAVFPTASRRSRGKLSRRRRRFSAAIPPAGLEPAASGLRARRHHPFDHGGLKLRWQDSNLRLTINSRASCQLDHTGTRTTEGEGVEPPRPQDPPVFETGYHSNGSPSSDPGRRRTCNLPVKSRLLCQLSYGAESEVWPAGIEPAQPRVSGERSTG
jgi:hypothetical protein